MQFFFACLAFLAQLADGKIVWGTATAAYQVEGYRSAGGRTKSIWDAFDTPGDGLCIKAVKPNGKPNVANNQSGARADEDYMRFSESLDLARSFGFGAARLSISWSRVMTYSIDKETGKLRWVRNEHGLAHYKTVLRKYTSANVKVALTMFHWDLPLSIEEHAMGMACGSAWLCHEWIGDVFEDYAALLLHELGDLVTWWITINEPLTIVNSGYANGDHAPGRCSNRELCWHGDSRIEPYVAAKGLLLAHARAFRAWERAGKPGVSCGILLSGDWRIPFTSSEDDKAAALRALEWQSPIFADPIHFGKWPDSVQSAAGVRVPVWTDAEIALVNGSHDSHFFMNHYTTLFAKALHNNSQCGWTCDAHANVSGYNFTSGKAIGTPSSNGWLFNYGPGLGELVAWYNQRYKGLRYIIAENGWGDQTASSKIHDLLDSERCNYYRDYIGNLSAVVARENITVDAFFAWSLMDNFEWADGYTTRFGLTYVDYDTQHRTAKLSAAWFRSFITSLSNLPNDGQPLPACDSSSVVDRLI